MRHFHHQTLHITAILLIVTHISLPPLLNTLITHRAILITRGQVIGRTANAIAVFTGGITKLVCPEYIVYLLVLSLVFMS
jgi:hypothetical protein